jgi:hypothetical protein
MDPMGYKLWFTSWWYTYPSEKYESQLRFPKYGNIKQMFQTTSQLNKNINGTK